MGKWLEKGLLPIKLIYHYFVWAIFFLFFKIVYRLRVYGRENIPKGGFFIIAPNHASYLDPPLVGVAFIRPLRYFARKGLFNNIVLNIAMRSMGAVPIGTELRDLKPFLSYVDRFKNTNQPFVLFPEGARTYDGNFCEPQPGIGMVVERTKARVIPVYLKGTYEALPRGAKWLRPSNIEVYIGRPVEFADNPDFSGLEKKERWQAIANAVMSYVSALSEDVK